MNFWLKHFFLIATIIILGGRGLDLGFCHDTGASYSVKTAGCAEHVTADSNTHDHGSGEPLGGFCHHGCCEVISTPTHANELGNIEMPQLATVLVMELELPNPFLLDQVDSRIFWINETGPPDGFSPTRSLVRLL